MYCKFAETKDIKMLQMQLQKESDMGAQAWCEGCGNRKAVGVGVDLALLCQECSGSAAQGVIEEIEQMDREAVEVCSPLTPEMVNRAMMEVTVHHSFEPPRSEHWHEILAKDIRAIVHIHKERVRQRHELGHTDKKDDTNSPSKWVAGFQERVQKAENAIALCDGENEKDLREQLVKMAAFAMAWIQAIDRYEAGFAGDEE